MKTQRSKPSPWVGGLLMAALPACAAIFGVEDPIRGDPSALLPGDGGGDGNATINGGSGGDVAGACAEKTPSAAVSTFVSPNGTAAGGCGPRATPCNSVQLGIDHLPGKGTVYVAGGTYVEQVKLRSDVTVSGGWKVNGAAWDRACGDDAARAIIQAPAGKDRTIIADSLGGSAELVELTVKSKAMDAAPGESLYGVFAAGNSTTATTLTLNDVRVVVANGGPGVTGTTGAVGGVGPMPPGTKCMPSASQSPPPPAAAGKGAADPRATATGIEPNDGLVGDTGAPGANGTAGTGSCVTTCATCNDNTGCVPQAAPMACGTGYAGCGGLGGAGGTGGKGGGASVGVFAFGATVKILGGTLHSGVGGAGGGGGAGGTGGPGSAGAKGIAAKCDTACGMDAMGNCVSKSPMMVAAGMPGGNGGIGGAGGTGGGGGGGLSCLVYVGDSATASVESSLLEVGTGGAGGAPGGPAGKALAKCP